MGSASPDRNRHVHFNSHSLSRERSKGSGRYLPLGGLSGDSDASYRIEISDARDMPLALLYAAFLLSQHMERAPGAASISVEDSVAAPVTLTSADITNAQPEQLSDDDLRQMYGLFGIRSFSQIQDTTRGEQLEDGQWARALADAAITAYNRAVGEQAA